ncbi:MAG: DNA polymerase III subunit delta [Clostridiales bacterium]|jgi:DNA polymerase-3 subunit delta|nr:DNA polymerase III subunit delta [Clostridiales bacterium]
MAAKSSGKKASSEVSVEELSKDIKEGNFKSLYVFYGEEDYLKDFYINLLKKSLIGDNEFSYVKFEGKITPEAILWECETIPMLSENKVILIRNSGLFKPRGQAQAKSDDKAVSDVENENNSKETGDADAWSFLAELPPQSYVIFKESDADKRSKMYKLALAHGSVMSCVKQNEENIRKVLKKTAERNNRNITPGAVNLMITGVSDNITRLLSELEKLILFTNEGGTISEQEVREVCELSFQSKIFDLTDAIGEGNHSKALQILENLLSAREPAQLILIMIGRQYLQLYNVKKLINKGATTAEVCSKVGVLEFVARKLMKQANFFTPEQLYKKAMFCMEMDESIKNGLIRDVTALELLVST